LVGRPAPGSRNGGGAWRDRGGSGGVRSSKSFRAASADPRLEFYAEAGAPEGALYLDGKFVGWVSGVKRL